MVNGDNNRRNGVSKDGDNKEDGGSHNREDGDSHNREDGDNLNSKEDGDSLSNNREDGDSLSNNREDGDSHSSRGDGDSRASRTIGVQEILASSVTTLHGAIILRVRRGCSTSSKTTK